MEIIIVFLITLLVLFGNGINLKVFCNKKLEKVTTFRYLFCLAILDIILMIVWLTHKLITTGYLMIPKSYSEIIFKIMAFTFNLLSQMNVCIFTAANVNKAILVINESKHVVLNQKLLHVKVVIVSITIFLLILNSHYLVFFNFSQVSFENDDLTMNRTHQFVYQYIKNPQRNFTKFKIDLIMNKTNLMKINQTDQEIFEYNFVNYDGDHFIYKIWSLTQLILFDLIPIIINTTSTIIISRYNQRLESQKRKNINKQFVLLFITINILHILTRVIKSLGIIYYKMNEYQLETFITQILFELNSYSKYSFSFFIYLSTLKIYRSVIRDLFSHQKKIENIQLNQISSRIILNNQSNRKTEENKSNGKKTNQFLTVDDDYIRSIPRDDHFRPFKSNQSQNITWIGSDFFRQNSQ